jgi:hypothetical protein
VTPEAGIGQHGAAFRIAGCLNGYSGEGDNQINGSDHYFFVYKHSIFNHLLDNFLAPVRTANPIDSGALC